MFIANQPGNMRPTAAMEYNRKRRQEQRERELERMLSYGSPQSATAAAPSPGTQQDHTATVGDDSAIDLTADDPDVDVCDQCFRHRVC
jgi:hypothetical protein